MSESWKSQTFTTEFGHEIEAERERWLRRRFLWYAGAVLVINLIPVLAIPFRYLLPESERGGQVEFLLSMASSAFTLLLYGGAFWYVKTRHSGRLPPLRVVYWLIIITGIVQLLAGPILARGVVEQESLRVQRAGLVIDMGSERPATEASPSTGDGSQAEPERAAPAPKTKRELTPRERALATVQAGGLGAFGLLGLHFFACLFLPWTPSESIKPLVPLLILNAVIIVAFMGHATLTGVGSLRLAFIGSLFILISAFVAVPGAAICWWRNSRFRDRLSTRMLRGRYLELRQELTNARTIHESLFPRPHLTGPIRFNYVYEPMRQIGGDYLYASFHTSGGAPQPRKSLSIVLIDVTGHGIPAALTVNRLHGELERIFAEHPEISPGEVLRLLNSYVHLTLATHSVYVTAVCFRVDSTSDTLDYASGGHPPAFIRTGDGRVEQLDSTSFVLGACAGSEFHPAEKTIPFHIGDTLIAYTDGALEARDKNGRFLGVNGMLKVVASVKPTPGYGLPAAILKTVEQHRHGPTEDDTLVIEVTRVADSAPEPARKTGIFIPAATIDK